MPLLTYIRAVRLPFVTGSLVPVVIAGAYGYTMGSFRWAPFLFTALGVSLLQFGANTINDYFDAPGTDRVNLHVTPFSGGSRVVQEGLLSRRAMLVLSIILFAAAFAIGLGLSLAYRRPAIFLLGFLGFLGGLLYSMRPVNLMARGMGEATIFLAFGPLVTLGTYYVLSGQFSWQAFVLGIPPGFLITAVIWINQFPDYQADSQTMKRNLVVRMGREESRWVFAALMLLPFPTILIIGLIPTISSFTLAAFLTLPLAVKAVSMLWNHFNSPARIVPAQALTIQTHSALGLLVSAGLIVSRLIM